MKRKIKEKTDLILLLRRTGEAVNLMTLEQEEYLPMSLFLQVFHLTQKKIPLP